MKSESLSFDLSMLIRLTKKNMFVISIHECRCSIMYNPFLLLFFRERYWYASSDGYGNLGPRGDCGHAKVTPMECPAGKIMNYTGPCAGRGGCDNATMTCQCYKGFEGPACELRSCPVGNAWFDEASADGVAHAPVSLYI